MYCSSHLAGGQRLEGWVPTIGPSVQRPQTRLGADGRPPPAVASATCALLPLAGSKVRVGVRTCLHSLRVQVERRPLISMIYFLRGGDGRDCVLTARSGVRDVRRKLAQLLTAMNRFNIGRARVSFRLIFVIRRHPHEFRRRFRRICQTTGNCSRSLRTGLPPNRSVDNLEIVATSRGGDAARPEAIVRFEADATPRQDLFRKQARRDRSTSLRQPRRPTRSVGSTGFRNWPTAPGAGAERRQSKIQSQNSGNRVICLPDRLSRLAALRNTRWSSGHRAAALHRARKAEADRAFVAQHGSSAEIRQDPDTDEWLIEGSTACAEVDPCPSRTGGRRRSRIERRRLSAAR